MFFALLRLSLTEKSTSDVSLVFANVNTTDWEQVFSLSVRQGTVLLTYGGLQHLPVELQPPRNLKLRWCANVIKGSERYDRYKLVIRRLSHLFSEKEIELLILKGVTISKLYPVPYYREGGDVDIYLFGKAQQGDELMSSLGVNVTYPIPKHSAFVFEGQRIENHYTFLDTDVRFRRESLFYQKMEEMLRSMFTIDDCPLLETGSARQLPPQAAALYLIGHTFRHFCFVELNVRQLCDWMVFFTQCREQIDHELLTRQIKELGIERFVAAIHSFCSTYLGFKPSFMIPDNKDKQSANTILKIVMKYRMQSKVRVPVITSLHYIFSRNRLYNRYLAGISPSEFLFPELRSYFSYLWKRLTKPVNQQ